MGNYIQTNSHLDIINKVAKIRESIPTKPIFILAETPLLEYLAIHSLSPGELEKDVWLVQDNYTGYGRNQTFNEYRSAIFSTSQMKGNHEFELHYKLERGNRQWKIYTAIISKLAMDIPADFSEDENKELIPQDTDNNHSRWSRIR